MNKQKIKIDIVSDINCPWCYIGEHRLKKAIEEAGDAYEFDLTFKPFELNPQAPQDCIYFFLRNALAIHTFCGIAPFQCLKDVHNCYF